MIKDVQATATSQIFQQALSSKEKASSPTSRVTKAAWVSNAASLILAASKRDVSTYRFSYYHRNEL